MINAEIMAVNSQSACFIYLFIYLLFSHNKDYTSITLYKDVARGPQKTTRLVRGGPLVTIILSNRTITTHNNGQYKTHYRYSRKSKTFVFVLDLIDERFSFTHYRATYASLALLFSQNFIYIMIDVPRTTKYQLIFHYNYISYLPVTAMVKFIPTLDSGKYLCALRNFSSTISLRLT